MEDLLSEELGLDNDSAPTNTLPEGDKNEKTQAEAAPSDNADRGIEDDIERELAELAGQSVAGEKRKRPSETTSGEADSASKTAKLGLVTLDIPCVSFVRFPLGFEHEPVSVVTKICRDAESQPERQRSRFIKRLTPLSRVRKVMSGGVEELCKDVLPPVFGDGQPRKYAVRVTVRNNNQVEKDQIIKTVAGAVRELGLVGGDDAESKHKVSLKGYDNLVLVEIYRNVVGMSVVGDDWERLRRFNLSEIYAEGRKAKNDSESQRKPAVTEVQSAD
ncbi:uncharacterized protein HMPREF1541_07460 [Cyphellophora europaea CBS 101466]|uniref:THUMP domain-containing protein n=1 Tax=Cyphellophora europaea (strain CBS 101466) TaxID=1220924 RepID=W2RMZ7_CYPE1|nr:uncharacterized protein HMPREF1541_07460 [Cyphellophora europaea CBS 101466]ETN37837.1 hypothetical protein HMPREF1541_07460 [Cyphellophora europaea CBS 101466]